MIEYVKLAIRFIVTFIAIFFLYFSLVIIFESIFLTGGNIFLLLKNYRELFFSDLIISIINTLLLSNIYYSIFFIDKDNINKFFIRIIPLTISLIIFIHTVVIFNVDSKKIITHTPNPDLNSFIDMETYFDYQNEIPESFNDKTFDEILKKVTNNERKILRKYYIKKSYDEKYTLFTGIGIIEINKIRNILKKLNVMENIKFYFYKTNNELNCIVSKDNYINNYKNIKYKINNEKLIVSIDDNEYFFKKKIQILKEENNFLIFEKIKNNNVNFIKYILNQRNRIKVLFFFILLYIILSITIYLHSSYYPLLTLFANLVFVIFIISYYRDMIYYTNKIYDYLIPGKFIKYKKEIFFISVFLIFFIINYLKWLLYILSNQKGSTKTKKQK